MFLINQHQYEIYKILLHFLKIFKNKSVYHLSRVNINYLIKHSSVKLLTFLLLESIIVSIEGHKKYILS